jgi:uncharacterized protein with HEPN domain
MSPKPTRLKDYLRHIVEAIDRATKHIADIPSQQDFESDLKSGDAVVRCIEIVGEAATKIAKVAPSFIADNQDVPWEAMSAMRHKLIHDYFEVDYGVVWRTIKDDLPPLRKQIVTLLETLPNPQIDS